MRTLYFFIIACLSLCSPSHAAKEILLRLQPTAEAPVIAKITASEKVILDAPPAPENAVLGWRQLALPTPFEGYVPVAALEKSLKILTGTPVHYLPTANSAKITQVETADRYEVVRVKEEWATVRFQKDITGYFIDDSNEDIELDFDSLQVPLVATKPAPTHTAATEFVTPHPVTPQPLAIPAPRTRVNPDEPIGQLDPKQLAPENVVWQPARITHPTSRITHPTSRITHHESRTPNPASRITHPASRITHPASRITHHESRITNPAIMVSPAQTQAREATPDLGPAKTPRMLTGLLTREINLSGPGYPIRLKSPEGQLIAYVDFSGIYINDLSPYIGQKVYIRGQIYPLPENSSRLVILAESLRLSD